MVDQLDSLIETYNAISALFPDDSPHKNPVTGVSLLDDVRDAMEELSYSHYKIKDLRYELEQEHRQLEDAAMQFRHLQVFNESLLKSLSEPLMTALPPQCISAPLGCIFCSFKGTLAELKQHSAGCQEHPAVKALSELR